MLQHVGEFLDIDLGFIKMHVLDHHSGRKATFWIDSTFQLNKEKNMHYEH